MNLEKDGCPHFRDTTPLRGMKIVRDLALGPEKDSRLFDERKFMVAILLSKKVSPPPPGAYTPRHLQVHQAYLTESVRKMILESQSPHEIVD